MLEVIIFGFDEKIKSYLDKFAEANDVFKDKYENSGKTIKGCCKYITDKMREIASKSGASRGCLQVEDDVVYQMAVEYFEEDAIKEEKPKEKPTEKPAAPTEPKCAKLAKDKKEKEKAQEKGQLLELSLF